MKGRVLLALAVLGIGACTEDSTVVGLEPWAEGVEGRLSFAHVGCGTQPRCSTEYGRVLNYEEVTGQKEVVEVQGIPLGSVLPDLEFESDDSSVFDVVAISCVPDGCPSGEVTTFFVQLDLVGEGTADLLVTSGGTFHDATSITVSPAVPPP